MKLTQKESLYEQYKMMSDERLQDIINDSSYEEVAKEVAREILNSDRKEYKQHQNKIKQLEQEKQRIEEEKYSAQQINPLYEDLHQIANDVRFIKNSIIAEGIIAFILIIVSIIITSN